MKAARRVPKIKNSVSLAIMTPCFITLITNYCCVNCIPDCTLHDYMPPAKALGNYQNKGSGITTGTKIIKIKVLELLQKVPELELELLN